MKLRPCRILAMLGLAASTHSSGSHARTPRTHIPAVHPVDGHDSADRTARRFGRNTPPRPSHTTRETSSTHHATAHPRRRDATAPRGGRQSGHRHPGGGVPSRGASSSSRSTCCPPHQPLPTDCQRHVVTHDLARCGVHVGIEAVHLHAGPHAQCHAHCTASTGSRGGVHRASKRDRQRRGSRGPLRLSARPRSAAAAEDCQHFGRGLPDSSLRTAPAPPAHGDRRSPSGASTLRATRRARPQALLSVRGSHPASLRPLVRLPSSSSSAYAAAPVSLLVPQCRGPPPAPRDRVHRERSGSLPLQRRLRGVSRCPRSLFGGRDVERTSPARRLVRCPRGPLASHRPPRTVQPVHRGRSPPRATPRARMCGVHCLTPPAARVRGRSPRSSGHLRSRARKPSKRARRSPALYRASTRSQSASRDRWSLPPPRTRSGDGTMPRNPTSRARSGGGSSDRTLESVIFGHSSPPSAPEAPARTARARSLSPHSAFPGAAAGTPLPCGAPRPALRDPRALRRRQRCT